MSTPDSDAPISPLAGLGIAVLAVSTSAILVRWSAAPSLVKAFYRVLFTVALLAPVGRNLGRSSAFVVRHLRIGNAFGLKNVSPRGEIRAAGGPRAKTDGGALLLAGLREV